MTHPSHHLNFGMNPDHARNSLSNCGIRQPKYGDRKVHHMYMRKKGELRRLATSCWTAALSVAHFLITSLGGPGLGPHLFSRHQHVDQHHVPPGPGRPLPLQVGFPAGMYLPAPSPTAGAIKGTVHVINAPGRPAGKKINSNCERKGTSRGDAKLANFFKGNASTTVYRA